MGWKTVARAAGMDHPMVASATRQSWYVHCSPDMDATRIVRSLRPGCPTPDVYVRLSNPKDSNDEVA
jgi:hypothetical protein